MNDGHTVAWGLLLPFLGTTIGAATVYFFNSGIEERTQKALLGFASGVMIAASVWSLLLPAIDMAGGGRVPAFVPAVTGFLCGIGFLLLLDKLIPQGYLQAENAKGSPPAIEKNRMLFLAVTLHNIPEGMAVGVALAGMLHGDTGITAAGALALSLGIAIQNLPEGAIISAPLASDGFSKNRAFLYGTGSGIVEPIGGALTIVLTAWIAPILPYILSFAAGAMIYVVVEELIPEAQTGEHSHIGTIGASFGFALMMLLDVALG